MNVSEEESVTGLNKSMRPPSAATGADSSGRQPDLIDLALKKWHILVGGVIGGMLAGLAVTLIVNPQWEATTVLRIAQVPSTQVPGYVAVESATRLVERVKLASFESRYLQRLGLSSSRSDPATISLLRSVRVRALDRADLVSLRVWGPSREDAARYAGGIIAEIRDAHAEISKPSIVRLENLLADARVDRRRSQEQRDKLLEMIVLRESLPPGTRFAESVLLTNMLALLSGEYRAIADKILALEEQLNPERSYESGSLEPIEVKDEKVFPNRPVFAMVGAALGLVVVCLGMLVRSR